MEVGDLAQNDELWWDDSEQLSLDLLWIKVNGLKPKLRFLLKRYPEHFTGEVYETVWDLVLQGRKRDFHQWFKGFSKKQLVEFALRIDAINALLSLHYQQKYRMHFANHPKRLSFVVKDFHLANSQTFNKIARILRQRAI